MVKIVDKQNIFNHGILSPKLYSRDDLKQFNGGVADALNFICSRYGPMEKRTGTQFIWDLNNPNEKVFFLPFVFSVKQSVLLEFLANKIRFYTFDGTEFGPIAAPGYSWIATDEDVAYTNSDYGEGLEWLDGVFRDAECTNRRGMVEEIGTTTAYKTTQHAQCSNPALNVRQHFSATFNTEGKENETITAMWKYRRAYEKPTGTGMKYRAIDGRLFDISQSTTTQVDGWTTGWTTAGPLYGIRDGKLYHIASASRVTQIGTEEGWTQISDHSTGSYNQHTYAIREGRLYAISQGEAFEIGADISTSDWTHVGGGGDDTATVYHYAVCGTALYAINCSTGEPVITRVGSSSYWNKTVGSSDTNPNATKYAYGFLGQQPWGLLGTNATRIGYQAMYTNITGASTVSSTAGKPSLGVCNGVLYMLYGNTEYEVDNTRNWTHVDGDITSGAHGIADGKLYLLRMSTFTTTPDVTTVTFTTVNSDYLNWTDMYNGTAKADSGAWYTLDDRGCDVISIRDLQWYSSLDSEIVDIYSERYNLEITGEVQEGDYIALTFTTTTFTSPFITCYGKTFYRKAIQYEIETPFSADQLDKISYVQSLDMIYLAFADRVTPPYTLARYANNNWKLDMFAPEDGPYLDKNYNTQRRMQITDKNTDKSSVALSGFSLDKQDIGRWIRICTPRYNENTYVYEDKWSYGKIKSIGNYAWSMVDASLYTTAELPAKKATVYKNRAKTIKAETTVQDINFDSTPKIKVGNKWYVSDGTPLTGIWKWDRVTQATYFRNDNPATGDTVYAEAACTTAIGTVAVRCSDYAVDATGKPSYVTADDIAQGIIYIEFSDTTYGNYAKDKIKKVGTSIEVEWSYRNKVDEEDNDWMTAATSEWRLGVWHTGTSSADYPVTYPTKVTIHQQRLTWSGLTDKPWIWTSNSFAYSNYAPSDYEGEISDTNSIYYDISTDKVSDIFWLKSVKSLLIGTELGELRMYSAGTAITPADVVTARESSYGCHNSEPIVNDDNIVFIQRLQRTLRSLSYDYNQDAFVGPELTILAEGLTTGGIKKVVFQKEPNNTYWCLKEDGTLLTLTYDKSQDVIGWSKSALAGRNVKVIDLAVLPSNDNGQDMVMFAVEREVGGVTRRYLELLSRNFIRDIQHKEAAFLDCSVHIASSDTFNIIDGLDFLEEQTVRVMDEGSYLGDFEVELGRIVLPVECKDVIVGLPYNAYFETLERDFQDRQLSTKMSKLRVYKIHMYVDRTMGVSLYRLAHGSETQLTTFNPTTNMDTTTELLTGKVEIDVHSNWECDYRLRITSEPGLPCTIAGLILGVEINAI